MRDALRLGLGQLELALSEHQQNQLLDYLVLLQKWNKAYNLTAIRESAGMLTHHLFDSLVVVKPLVDALKNKPNSSILDVGAGAGLPGVVVAICCPDIRVTCVDAVGKKVAFMQQVALSLGLKNLTAKHARVESLTEKYDLITSRAFATLTDFVSCTQQSLANGGVWMAMKSKSASTEAADLPSGIDVFHVEPLIVPELNEERNLVWMRLH